MRFVKGVIIEKATFSIELLDNVGLDAFKSILNGLEDEYGIYVTQTLLEI